MTRRVKINDLDLASDINIAGETGMDIEVDISGLSLREIERLREKIYPGVIRSFQKHSQVMEKLLQGAIDHLEDPSVAQGGHTKCIYCRIKTALSNTGAGVQETYSRELVASLDLKDEESKPEIDYSTSVTVGTKDGPRNLRVDVDAVVMKELLQHMKEDEAKARIKELARKKVELDTEQFIPIRGIARIVIAKHPLPGSLRLRGVDFGKLTGKHPNAPTASITFEFCYEDDDCQCSWCEEITLGSAMV